MAADEKKVRRIVLTQLARSGIRYVPAAISARHLHLCARDLEILFGPGYELTPLKKLVQPGQFATKEQLILEGPRGRIEKVRIIGPVRAETQVEISLTDSFALGIRNCPVRMSGDTAGTPGIRVIGPRGQIDLDHGVIVARRHLHLSGEQAMAYGIHDGQIISLKVDGPRPCILNDVVCRTGEKHELEFHIDTDEANGCCLSNEQLLEVLPDGPGVSGAAPSRAEKPKQAEETGNEGSCTAEEREEEPIWELVTEREVNEAFLGRRKKLFCEKEALITPLARDRAGELGIRIERTPGKKKRPEALPNPGETVLDLITERDINDAYRDNRETVFGSSRALVTEAARERAAASGIRIVRTEGGETCRSRG